MLGDRYGTSCAPAISETIEETLRSLGYSVSRNKPYAGGFITEHYGNPAAGLHSLQLELNRALYMDERRYERSASFAQLRTDLESVADRVGSIPVGGIAALPRRGGITPSGRWPKKGPLASKRPKSREETPKEGGG